MPAGVSLNQNQIDQELASRIRQLNRLGFELRKIKETFDRLGSTGLIELPTGGRTPWTTEDVAQIRLAVNALVAYFDGFSEGDNAAIKALLDSLAGFGF